MSISLSGALPRPVAAAGRPLGLVGGLAVLAATVFNILLCFVYTAHWMQVGSTQIILCELAILAVVMVAVRHRLSLATLLGSVLTLGTVVALKLLNSDIDLKIIHDLMIIPLFLTLGQACSRRSANLLVTTLLCVVIAVGLFELLAPELFQHLFDVWSFYVDKGALDAHTVNYSNTRLFVSGERSQEAGRTLLPGLLGNHRVSSVFLEPVSLGNFAVLCLAWLLSMPMGRGRRLWLLAGAATCAVLPDSRFSIGCGVAMLLLRATGLHRSRVVAAVLPVLVVVGLMLAGAHLAGLGPPRLVDDDLSGRLSFSGSLLDSWGWRQWLGLQPSATYTADTGVAYAVVNLGLPLAAGLWLCFALLPTRTVSGQSMRGLLAVYLSTSLCVGASIFSIKTGGLCWFLLGVAISDSKTDPG